MEVVNRKKKPASGDDNLTRSFIAELEMKQTANKAALFESILVWVPQFRNTCIEHKILSIFLFKIKLKI